MTTQPRFHLRLLGGATLIGPDGQPLGGRAGHRHRLALLALLARSLDRGVSRDVLMAQLWPDSHAEQARNLLKVSVYVLRQALGEGALLSTGGALRLDSGVVSVDVVAFESAVAEGDFERAASLYSGPFLEAFFLRGATEFEHWVDRERASLADTQSRALESLALAAEADADWGSSVGWWKALTAHDPFDSRVALRLMQALTATGNRAGAITHARIHARLLAEEFGIDAPPEIEAFVARLDDGAPGATPPVIHGPQQREHPDPMAPDPHQPSGVTSSDPEDALPSGQSSPRLPVRQSVGWRLRSAMGLASLGAVAVVAVLLAEPRNDARLRSAQASTTDVVAWDLYQRASQPEMLRSDSSARAALALLAEAVALDPGFAAAHAGVARMLLRVGPTGEPKGRQGGWIELAQRHATTATRLDSLSAEAYGTLGVSEMMLYRFTEAEENLDRAILLDPDFGRAREWKVATYLFAGRYEAALAQAREAVAADPLSPTARAELGRVLLVLDRCDEALAEVLPLSRLKPPLLRAGPIAAQCYARRGSWDEALEYSGLGGPAAGARGRAWRGYALARAGRTAEATEILDELSQTWATTGAGAFFVALVLTGLDRPDQACEWLWRSLDDHTLSFEVREPAFSPLHAHPLYRDLVRHLESGTP